MPKPLFHRIAALAFLRARIVSTRDSEQFEVVECRAGGREDTQERDLLSGFWRAFEEWKPRLVTWNGRGFALPVLKYRSMRHRLSAHYLHEAGDKWSGYGNRYSTRHIDLMDVLSDHHASPFPTLGEVAECFSIPYGPLPGTELPAAGPRLMAELDAAITFAAYLRWRAFTGAMSWPDHDAALASLDACRAG